MKTSLVLFPLALAATVAGRAQSPAAIATPSTPAPSPVATSPALASAANRIIYAPRLPTAAELTAVAAAQNLVIAKIEVAPTQVYVTWQAEGAAATTVVYRLLSSVDASAPEAVSRPALRAIYYDDFPGYYGYPAYYGYPGYYRYPYGYGPGFPSISLGFHAGFGGHRGHGRGR